MVRGYGDNVKPFFRHWIFPGLVKPGLILSGNAGIFRKIREGTHQRLSFPAGSIFTVFVQIITSAMG
jgi:hypothetical protein